MKKGLVLEGGAMRGMFTAGVIDVLMEHGIEFDGAVGVSAGAAFGCNYKSRQIGRVIRYNTNFCNDKRYGGIGVLLKTGNFYSAEFAYNEVPLEHDIFDFETYENNPMEFYVVCTDLETGKAFYHKYEGKDDHGFEWIRASSSMPMVSNIVEIEGKKFLDGGIADPIPLKFFVSIGYDRNIVVLTRPAGYTKSKSRFMTLFNLKYKAFPFFIETMKKRPEEYNKTLKYIRQKEKLGEVLVIRPSSPLPVSRTEKDPDKLRMAYNIGREDAIARIDEIKKYLNYQ